MAAKPLKTLNPNDGKKRCAWAAKDPILAYYHDREWGKPIKTEAGHLERIAHEIFQCGLSWKIVLVKRDALYDAFNGFDVDMVAKMTKRDVDRMCNDASIIRNRRKIEAVIDNAKKMCELRTESGTYLKWLKALPATSTGEQAALFPLFKKTFKFMGPETTKCYLMGVGKIPPDHERACWAAKN